MHGTAFPLVMLISGHLSLPSPTLCRWPWSRIRAGPSTIFWSTAQRLFWHFARFWPHTSVSPWAAWTSHAALPSWDKPRTRFGQLQALITKWTEKPGNTQIYSYSLVLWVTNQLKNISTSLFCTWSPFLSGCTACLPVKGCHTVVPTGGRVHGNGGRSKNRGFPKMTDTVKKQVHPLFCDNKLLGIFFCFCFLLLLLLIPTQEYFFHWLF